MTAVFEKELKSYFNNASGFVYAAFMLLFAGIYVMVIHLKSGSPNFEYVMGNMTFIYLIITPVLTMRIISEERRQKTDQLLYSLPMSMTKIVLGKYLAMLAVIAIPLLIMCFYPFILRIYGAVNFKAAYSAIFGYFCMGAGMIAIGMFISSMTENQAVAAVLTLVVLLINNYLSILAYYVSGSSTAAVIILTVISLVFAVISGIMTKNAIFAVIVGCICETIFLILIGVTQVNASSLIPSVMAGLSLFSRFDGFTEGVFDVSAIIFYLAVSGVFVFLTVQAMEKRRWS